jgi:hypothetical protein
MKKEGGIILALCLMSLLMTAEAYAQEKVSVTTLKRGQKQNPDTLNMNRLLRIDPFSLEIVPPSMGVRFYRNGIVFLSISKNEGKMLQSHTSFGNVEAYYASFSDTVTEEHKLFSEITSYKVPCDGMTFNKDYSVMYYTKLPGKNEPEKIYRAEYKLINNETREWKSDPNPINICNDGSTYLNPALSAGGDTMVFASDRKQSFGGFDLFITHFDGIRWSSPENLGNSINSSGNELFPFIDSGNNLYFSSDGLKGSGGYDIFVCRFNGEGWEKPLNLTKEINTPKDEIAFNIDRDDQKYAFFTSRSKSAGQPLKLYRLTFGNPAAYLKMKTLPNAIRYITGTEVTKEEPVILAAATPAKAKPEAKPITESRPRDNVQSNVQADVPVAGNLYLKKAKPASGQPSMTVQKPAGKKPEPADQNVIIPQATPAQAEKKPEPTKTMPQEKPSVKGSVVYRIQFSSGSKSKGSIEVTFGGKTYKTFEYLYNGLYRSCVGEFRTPAEAAVLNKTVKKEGFPDAFVAAFINNVRSLDPSMFK